MQRFIGLVGLVLIGVLTGTAWGFDLTPAIQKELDRKIEVVKGWAASPVIVKAVPGTIAYGESMISICDAV